MKPNNTSNFSADRQAALAVVDQVIQVLNKRHGDGTIQRFGQELTADVPRLSTGSLKLDLALGGGIAKGGVIEIHGEESSGKTTLALHLVREAQKAGQLTAYIDVENQLDLSYAIAIGVSFAPEDMIFSQPDTSEAALDILRSLVETGVVGLIVLDSVAMLTPEAEMEQETVSDSQVGIVARQLAKTMRQIKGKLRQTEGIVVLINQLRSKIGYMQTGFDTPGGKAIKYAALTRIKTRIKERPKTENDGVTIEVEIVKNKRGRPYKKEEYVIRFGEGIDVLSEYIDLGVELGIVQKSGAWFNWNDWRVQGRERLRQILKEQPALADELARQVQRALRGEPIHDDTASSPTDSSAD